MKEAKENSVLFSSKKWSEKYQNNGINWSGGRRCKMKPSFLKHSLIFGVKWIIKLKTTLKLYLSNQSDKYLYDQTSFSKSSVKW